MDGRGSPPTSSDFDAEKRGGILVGLFLMVFLGAGGAGGYWYFMMDAQWPLPFMQQASQPDSGSVTPPDDSLQPRQDSLLMAAADSNEVRDSMAVEDTTAVEDTVLAPTPLPETGVLVLTGVGTRGRVFLDGDEVRGLTHELPPGSVHVWVRRSGYEDFETSAPIARGDTVSVGVQWTRLQVVEPPAPVPQCDEPRTSATFNLNNYCFDAGPEAEQDGPYVIRSPDIPRRVTTAYWIEIGEDGTPTVWRSTARERSSFDVLALRWGQRNLTFLPATKAGRAVKGWILVPIQGRPQQ